MYFLYKQSCIYLILNHINHKRYIGQTIDGKARLQRHKSELQRSKHPNSHLQRAWEKYGENSFEFAVIEFCNKEFLDKREKFWIDYYDSMNNGYNIKPGGASERGWQMTDEQRIHLSEGQKRRVKSETRYKSISKALKKRYENHIGVGAMSVVCLNTKEVFPSASHAGKVKNANLQQILRCCRNERCFCGYDDNGERLVWMFKEDYDKSTNLYVEEKLREAKTHDRYMKRKKTIICLNTGETFESIAAATKHFDLDRTAISAYLHGRRKTAGKHPETNEPLEWAYVA